MRLRDLDAHFVGRYTVGPPTTYRHLRSVEGAQGLMFQCPKCAEGKKLGGNQHRRWAIGAHMVLCWFTNPRNAPRVPDDADPKPGRWTFSGNSIDDITFTGPAAASVLLTGGCMWHGFIRNGEATLS